MIIIKLTGGLGNQLFQYCFARSLAYNLNEELLLDVSFFVHSRPIHITYGLQPYNIKGVVGNFPLANKSRFFDILLNLNYYLFNKKLFKKYSFLNSIMSDLGKSKYESMKFYFNEPNLSTWDSSNDIYSLNLKNIETPAYFKGFFQFFRDSKNRLFLTDELFKDNLDLIHNDLTYIQKISDASKNIIDDIQNYDSVALHIRRGDYTEINDFGLCTLDYYYKSIEIMKSKLENPKFFIFCEDMEWVRDNLKIDAPHFFVDFEENINLVGRGYAELLEIMASCDHFIIANSTFSWWGAFLSKNKNKLIISPTPWFQNRRVLGVHSIDDKKPISVENNNENLYDISSNLICTIDNGDFSFNNLKYIKINEGYLLKNLNNSSKIILKNRDFNPNKRYIIKISVESNCFNCFTLVYKLKDKHSHAEFNIYYYEDDDFNHYVILPENAIINDLKLVLGKGFKNEDYLIIKSFEIKELFN